MNWKDESELVEYVQQIDCDELNRSADMWHVVIDQAGRFVYLSSYYFEKTGFRPDTVLGQRFVDFVQEDLTHEQRTQFEASVSSRRSIRNLLFRRTRPDGVRIYVRANAEPQFSDDGQFMGYLATSQDISEVVDDILSDGLLDVLDDCPLGVIVSEYGEQANDDFDSRVRYVNRTYAERLGFSKEQIANDGVPQSWCHGDELQAVNARLRAGGHLQSDEFARLTAKQELVWLEMTSQNIRIHGQAYTLIWHHDVTEKKSQAVELERMNRRLQQISTTDELTQLANRRAFNDALELEWNRARRNAQPLGVLMADLDWFKQYNDHFGHLKGDECLRAVGAQLSESARRAGDIAARYGGEEFALVFSATSEAQVHQHAQALCDAIAALELSHPLSPFGIVTISIGAAVIVPGVSDTMSELIDRADAALYRAKQHGRNRVETAAPTR